MATTNHSVQSVGKAGLVPTFNAVNAGTVAGEEGNTFANSGKEILIVNNGSGSQITLTILVEKEVEGLVVPDRTLAIAATSIGVIAECDPAVYGTLLGFEASAVTTVTCAVIRPL